MEDRSNVGSNVVNVTPSWVPQLGMKFSSVDAAWKFWAYWRKDGVQCREEIHKQKQV